MFDFFVRAVVQLANHQACWPLAIADHFHLAHQIADVLPGYARIARHGAVAVLAVAGGAGRSQLASCFWIRGEGLIRVLLLGVNLKSDDEA